MLLTKNRVCAPPSDTEMCEYGLAMYSDSPSPRPPAGCANSVSKPSSSARSRKASSGSLPSAAAMSAMLNPSYFRLRSCATSTTCTCAQSVRGCGRCTTSCFIPTRTPSSDSLAMRSSRLPTSGCTQCGI